MNTNFNDIMSKRTDDELIKIITVDREGYQPLAIEAAEEEISKRNLSTTKIEQVKIDLTSQVEEQRNFDSKKVSSLTRFIHCIIDTIAFVILAILIGFILGLFINVADQGLINILGYLMLAGGFFGYYVFMETKYQKTIGKFISKTRVVNKNGAKPDLGDIVRRTFCRLIPFDGISFLFTANGFHDRLSDTTIIKDEN